MLADARNVMPDELKFEGDKAFFTAALDRADLILHGRNSYEDQPNSPQRKRIILTRKVEAIAPDPANPKSTLWNPAGASFEAACDACRRRDRHRRRSSAGPACSACSWTATTSFWLSLAPRVRLPGRRALLSRRAPALAAGDPGGARAQRRSAADARSGRRRQRHAVAAQRLSKA